MIFHFIGSGNENDPYIDFYLAHEIPAQGNERFPSLRYCPAMSGHEPDYQCPYCAEGGYKLKERMIMWLWVYDILHTQLRDGETLPTVTFQGRNLYRRAINAPRLWDTSAWAQSPFDEIVYQHSTMGNLRNDRFGLWTTGQGLERRYQLRNLNMNEAINPELLAQAEKECAPVLAHLKKTLEQPETVSRSASASPAQSQLNAAPQPYNPGPAPAYAPGAPAAAAIPEGVFDISALKADKPQF